MSLSIYANEVGRSDGAMVQTYDVACLGNAIVDIICKTRSALNPRFHLAKGSMTLVSDLSEFERIACGLEPDIMVAGGAAANVATGVVSLGGRSAFFGRVADDEAGRIFRHDLQSVGVNIPVMPASARSSPTSRSLIIVTPDGHRTMMTYLGCSVEIPPKVLDAGVIGRSKYLVIEAYLFDHPASRETLQAAANMARRMNQRTVLLLCDGATVQRHRKEILSFVRSSVDVLIANESELAVLFQTGRLQDAIRATARSVSLGAITCGERGSLVIGRGEVVSIAAERVSKVVDKTGSGDLYAAGFLLGLARGMTIEQAGRLGSLVGAEIVCQVGARPEANLANLARLRGFIL